MISPKDILLHTDEKHVLKTLQDAIDNDGNYRADIAATQATRIVNYSLYHAKQERVDDKLITRLSKLMVHDMFTDDLKFLMVRDIINGNRTKFNKLLMNPTIVKYTTR
jgi:hypothetical protein